MVEKKDVGLTPQQAGPDSSMTAPPVMDAGLTFKEIGSTGLRQYSGWIREEFEPNLRGRQASRMYREMQDNSSIVGGSLLAMTGAMRKVPWRVEPANDTPAAQEKADFVESLMHDMNVAWEDFVTEALSMLAYGFAPHEIVYKKRQGYDVPNGTPKSKYDDGKIGIRKLALRGQDTVIKWFLGPNGEMQGLTQQPYQGTLIDIPVEKLLVFRPTQHKNNPEGRSILRSAYVNYYFTKRFQEQEAVLFERFSGLPCIKIPSEVLEASNTGDAKAMAIVEAYKKIVRNVRIDEQMGVLLPSTCYQSGTGFGPAQYTFELITPAGGRQSLNADVSITRHKLDMAIAMLTDFMFMGHSTRGAQNLGATKMDMFLQAVEGWLNAVAAVINRHLLTRVWKLNGDDFNLMPEVKPDTAQRPDLDVLSNFVLRLSQAGIPLFPDVELEGYIRDAAGMPDIGDGRAQALAATAAQQSLDQQQHTEDQAAQDQGNLETDRKITDQHRQEDHQHNMQMAQAKKPPAVQKLHTMLKGAYARRARAMGVVQR